MGAMMPTRTSVLKAVEYQFNMPLSDEHDVESGKKTLEIRYVIECVAFCSSSCLNPWCG